MEWINAKTRVPAPHQDVLLYLSNDTVHIGFRRDGMCCYMVNGNEIPYYKVLYWMPLPHKPE